MHSYYSSKLQRCLMILCIIWATAHGDECSAAGLQVQLVATSQRNATGDWRVSTVASSNLAARMQPRLQVEAELGVGACPGGKVTLSTVAHVAAAAPAGYERMPFPGVDSLYRLQTQALTWPEARAVCKAEGAHLIVVNSEAEAQVVKEFFARKPTFVGAINPHWLFVGLHKYDNRNETVLGGQLEDSGYAKWAPQKGQWSPGSGVDCGIMNWTLGYAYSRCSLKRAFICEFDKSKLRFTLYRLQTQALTWPEARAVCKAEGAHLIVVNSEAEAQVVKEFFARKPTFVGAINSDWIAVGLYKYAHHNETVLGGKFEDSGYAKWSPTENNWSPGPGMDCGIINIKLLFGYEECTRKRAFICELEKSKLRLT